MNKNNFAEFSKIKNMNEKFPLITIKTREEWRNWLKKNHLIEKKVGLVSYKKHTGKPSISHKAAMDEAICFGWIDTIIKRLDDKRFIRYFVRRGDGANWSINTLKYGKELLAAGRMAPAGMLHYHKGLQKKPLDHGLPKKPNMPAELKKGLNKKKALKNFMAFSPSTKYMFYRWILRAKREDTMNKIIDVVVKRALMNDNNL